MIIKQLLEKKPQISNIGNLRCNFTTVKKTVVKLELTINLERKPKKKDNARSIILSKKTETDFK